uniref:Unannotated protein n=1 Tax=freshwater metagenome TaxID=449393 RepID=A0A6J6A1Y1_9ZZZZ
MGAVSSAEGVSANRQVPDVFKPPPGNPRFPLFDGLRAVAAISILVYHGFGWSANLWTGSLRPWTANLDIGVPIFFVISGFLLYRPFVAANMKGERGPLAGRFYRRRVLRIVPAYWVALTVLSIYPLSREMFSDWPKYYFFLQNFSLSTNGLGQASSLCIEVSFYLVLPLYAFFTARAFRSASPTRRMQLEIALLIVLSLISAAFWNGYAHSLFWHPLGLQHYLYWFALGMSLALISAWSQHAKAQSLKLVELVGRNPGWCWALAIGLYVLLGALTGIPGGLVWLPGDSIIRWVLQPLIAALLVLPAVFSAPRQGVPGRFLMLRPVAWLGLISYGLFLWHLGVVILIVRQGWIDYSNPALAAIETTLLTLLITIPIAAVSYYVIERPFLRLKDHGFKRSARATGKAL